MKNMKMALKWRDKMMSIVLVKVMLFRCKHSVREWDMEYDAYFCVKCFEYLEEGCNDPKCRYCVNRPKNARRLE